MLNEKPLEVDTLPFSSCSVRPIKDLKLLLPVRQTWRKNYMYRSQPICNTSENFGASIQLSWRKVVFGIASVTRVKASAPNVSALAEATDNGLDRGWATSFWLGIRGLAAALKCGCLFHITQALEDEAFLGRWCDVTAPAATPGRVGSESLQIRTGILATLQAVSSLKRSSISAATFRGPLLSKPFKLVLLVQLAFSTIFR